MALSEADTRAKLIDPVIHACGWSEDMICRETKRALFLCDRDELRTQGLKAMQGVFGADAAEIPTVFRASRLFPERF